MIDRNRLRHCYDLAKIHLLSERNAAGHWEGELSTSALSTATAIMALQQVKLRLSDSSHSRDLSRHSRAGGNPVLDKDDGVAGVEPKRNEYSEPPESSIHELQPVIDNGLKWIAEHQNEDGGWGDTVKSISNISTTMLCHAVFHACDASEQYAPIVEKAKGYIDEAGGVEAVIKRYGKDKTFSVPILTHCALAGLVDWKQIPQLPFELSVFPHRFFAALRLPVVSYALPALIAIGQVRFHHVKSWSPVMNAIRSAAKERSLKKLISIQPENGGFLEATPLTSFVTMSLAGMGLHEHEVAKKGVEFLLASVRKDGSWPIDTNLATWVTTLSVNALKDDLPVSDRPAIREWLLEQQYKDVHPYTNAAPGGWAWTNLPGGVPDADDTPGALIALANLSDRTTSVPTSAEAIAVKNGAQWLLDLQNSNGGFPTFCKGWGTLPFDRSAADITAHCLRALNRWGVELALLPDDQVLISQVKATKKAYKYLEEIQRDDGSWLPLWFGNQFGHDDENPVFGTSRVLAAYRDAEMLDSTPAQRGKQFLLDHQNEDGGWGGSQGIVSSVEETALAVEVLAAFNDTTEAVDRGAAIG